MVTNFYGTISPNYQGRFQSLLDEQELQEVVFHRGLLSHKKCVESQANSSILLYMIESIEGIELSNKFSGVLTAKIFEYIYSGVPILAIVPP